MWWKERQYVLLQITCSVRNGLFTSVITSFSSFFLPPFLCFSYMSNLDRISSSDYIPTEQDVLRVRFPTTGIHDYAFSIKNITLRWPILRLLLSHRAKSNTNTIQRAVKKIPLTPAEALSAYVCLDAMGSHFWLSLHKAPAGKWRGTLCALFWRWYCFFLQREQTLSELGRQRPKFTYKAFCSQIKGDLLVRFTITSI